MSTFTVYTFILKSELKFDKIKVKEFGYQKISDMEFNCYVKLIRDQRPTYISNNFENFKCCWAQMQRI